MADFILNMPPGFFARVFGNPAGDPVLLKSRGVTLLRDILTGHQDKDQWNLFHMVLGFNICIDGPELSEGVAAQLEGTIYKPRLGFAEELKLFFGGKDKMVSFVDSYICSKKAIRNVILFQTEIQVYWVFGPGFLCKPACNLCQELWF